MTSTLKEYLTRILHPQNFKKLNKIVTTYSPCFMPFCCFNTPANIQHFLIYAFSLSI
jgi:hypothetical protein